MSNAKKLPPLNRILAEYRVVVGVHPGPWGLRDYAPHNMPYVVADAKGDDVAQVQQPHPTSRGLAQRDRLARFLADVPKLIDTLTAKAEAKEAALSAIAEVLSDIDNPNKHEDMLRRILRIVMDN